MPTTQEEKPAKPRARSRKADQRSSKGGQKQAEAAVDPVHPMAAETADVAVEVAPAVTLEPAIAMEQAVTPEPAVAMEQAVTPEPAVTMEQAVTPEPAVTMEQPETMEKLEATVLSGEVLPPEAVRPASQVDGLQAIAQAYGEYTKKSWLNGRFLMERLIAVRSFDEAIEIQGEFAKQACSNFLTQSERVCVLYGEWAQQFFRPLVWRL